MKIFSYLWALLILIAPFFISANIFENVNTTPFVTKVLKLYDCKESNVKKGSVEIEEGTDPVLACSNIIESYVSSLDYGDCGGSSASVKAAYGTYIIVLTYGKKDSFTGACNTKKKEFSIQVSKTGTVETEECQDDSLIRVDSNLDGETDSCAALTDIQQNDTCDYNDVYSNPVTEPAVCIAKSDGSQCAASAVALPNSSESVYMPTENDCYGDVYPILDENGGIGDMPDGSDQQCTESGALSYCPADPEEKCPNGQCEAGCGYMNDQFICVAPTQPPEPPECTGDDCGTEPPPCTGDDCGTEPPPCTGDDCGTGGGETGGECPAGDTTCGNGGGTQPCEAGSTDCIPCEAGDTSCSLVKGEKGSYDMEAAEAELLAIKEELQNKIDTIKSESSTLIPEINGGTASFNSCFDVVSFQGRKENRCLTEYADEMEIISKIMLFIFTVLSGFIVLSGVTKT